MLASWPVAASQRGRTTCARCSRIPLARQSISAAELIVSSWTLRSELETALEVSYVPSEPTSVADRFARQSACVRSVAASS